ncbi:MAG TPA: DUF1624 domain-containing protein [Rhizobiales bacterium]|nr:DUF1624 domain-containing protein [Hyphomicrobiales bacterium]
MTQPPSRRIEAIDLARGAALVAMAVYHFTWDLEFFGYAEAGLTAHGGWKIFARSIASSFLFLAGVSLFLAHGETFRRAAFVKRLAQVAGAAAAISAVTWFAVPSGFIFFGILHQIALASILGLAFLRLPWPVTLAAAAVFVAGPHFLRSEVFDHAVWWWLGLSSANPRSNDYVPLFPWFGAVLAGIAAARLARATGLLDRLARISFGRWSLALRLAGRHSLAVYLVHQPVLIACVWAFAQIFPAPQETREVRFMRSCERQCAEIRDGEFCPRYCACMLDAIDAAGLADAVFDGRATDDLPSRLADLAGICTFETDQGAAVPAPPLGGGSG